MQNKPSLWRSLVLGISVFIGIVVFAYGFEVVGFNLEETKSERRQTQLVRILRALARPDIFEYETKDTIVTHPIWVGCPEEDLPLPEHNVFESYIVVEPACANPRETIMVRGYNFTPNVTGPVNFIPPSEVVIQLGRVQTDSAGNFEVEVTLPNRQPLPEPQTIQAILRENVGLPKLTRTAHETWDKIVETVFMALLATVIGTIFAIPVSFFAARNLMKDVTSPLASASLVILGWPVGIWVGRILAQWLTQITTSLGSNFILVLGGMIVTLVLVWLITRYAIPESEDKAPTMKDRLLNAVVLISTVFLTALAVLFAGIALTQAGGWLVSKMQSYLFLATFVEDLGELVVSMVGAVLVLAAGAYVGSLGGQLGQTLSERLPRQTVRLMNFPLSIVSMAVLFWLIGAGLHWLYQFSNPLYFPYGPLALGAVIGLVIAIQTWRKDVVSVGLSVYYVVRTFLNALRSIEALIMVIVFAVWVGIGPFAGVLALSLHTIASLAKLYSEQVESIMAGPLEAIKATGATRLQTIIYAVIPQIVPPYIAFTVYRWDINVRMSTIIGFAGGGGIGFLLQQNINLLNYRAASAQMLAIAIVVATMDYISSVLRERVV